MVDIINLRKARKAKLRLQHENDAAENRSRYGRTLAERDRERAEAEQARRLLDGVKKDPA